MKLQQSAFLSLGFWVQCLYHPYIPLVERKDENVILLVLSVNQDNGSFL